MILCSTGPEIVLQMSLVIALIGLGHEHRDVAADDLLVGVAEDPLGGRIHRLDAPRFVDGDDAVDGRVDDGFEPDGRLADCLLGFLALGHVARDLGEAAQLVLLVENGLSTPLAKKRLPSLRQCQRSSEAQPLAAAVASSSLGYAARPGPPV